MPIITAYKCNLCKKIIEYDENNPHDQGRSNYIKHLKNHASSRMKERKIIGMKKSIDNMISTMMENVSDVDSIKKYCMDAVMDKLFSISKMDHIPREEIILNKIEVYRKNNNYGLLLKYGIIYKSNYDFLRCESFYGRNVSITTPNYYSILFEIPITNDENNPFKQQWKKLYTKAKLTTSAKKFTKNTFTMWKIRDDKNISV